MSEAAISSKSAIKMAPMIAFRNLVHDRLSLTVTLIGIVFSVVLVSVQCGLYLGSENKIAAVLDRVRTDLWVVPVGTKSFDDASLLSGREKFAALSTPGVAKSEEMVVSFSVWRHPQGGKKAITLVGLDLVEGDVKPWNLVEGTVGDLATPDSVAIDRSYFEDLGVSGIGSRAEINDITVQVSAVTDDIRSFTTLPFVFTPIKLARTLIEASPNQASYQLITLEDGADLDEVRAGIKDRLPNAEVLTHDEFRERSLDYWMFSTGAGSALITGALLGVIVGVVIVAQTLYSSTKDHLNEFATLRALGASAGYIYAVIMIQALLSAILGYILGMAMSLVVLEMTKKTALTMVMTPGLALGLFILTVGMCILAAISAIFKVTRIDPSSVFHR